MPFARINLPQHASPEVARAVSESVYDAMINVANVPLHDKFQVISRHAPEDMIYPEEGYLGNTYSPDIIFIQVTWNAGRSVAVKQAFYRSIADSIHAKTGIRKEDVWINLIDVARENWSFGNGDMQYAPVEAKAEAE